ncbi:hypothetical protein J6590_049892 [Homalodisca vitripennis]|nr:hypothetical protein J6590_049892 [Homalodisca vitripennis]
MSCRASGRCRPITAAPGVMTSSTYPLGARLGTSLIPYQCIRTSQSVDNMIEQSKLLHKIILSTDDPNDLSARPRVYWPSALTLPMRCPSVIDLKELNNRNTWIGRPAREDRLVHLYLDDGMLLDIRVLVINYLVLEFKSVMKSLPAVFEKQQNMKHERLDALLRIIITLLAPWMNEVAQLLLRIPVQNSLLANDGVEAHQIIFKKKLKTQASKEEVVLTVFLDPEASHDRVTSWISEDRCDSPARQRPHIDELVKASEKWTGKY